MAPDLDAVSDTADLLARFWGLRGADVEPLDGGINSETWLVRHDGSAYVAKRVAATMAGDLLAGCEVAAALAGAGIVTGRPVTTLDGRLVVTEHALALLERVPGRELSGDGEEEQVWMASVLAAVHHAGAPAPGPSSAVFMTDWLSPELPGVSSHPWLLRAVRDVRAETDGLDLTWSGLHTDPAPEAFVHDDANGVTGLIDWTGARRGPVLYDVASAVMYLGGPDAAAPFLDAYRGDGPLADAELRHLDAFRRLREVVQGTYFAQRLAARDLTGGMDQADNQQGLDDARRRLSALGL